MLSRFDFVFDRYVKGVLPLAKSPRLEDDMTNTIRSRNIIYFVLNPRYGTRLSLEIANASDAKAKKKSKLQKYRSIEKYPLKVTCSLFLMLWSIAM